MKFIFLAFQILFIFSCAAQGPAMGGPKDIIGPKLLIIHPENQSTGLLEDEDIVLNFNEMVDPTSVKSAISIENQNDFRIKVRRNRVFISPVNKWKQNQLLSIDISRKIRDFQGNMMNKGLQIIYSTGDKIPKGSIKGYIDNFDFNSFTSVSLFSYFSKDSLTYIKTVEADSTGQFSFLYLTPKRYTIFASEGKSQIPEKSIHTHRYGMSDQEFISLRENQTSNIKIYMDEPLEFKKNIGLEIVNRDFGYLKFDDGTTSKIKFKDKLQCTMTDDTISIHPSLFNRLIDYDSPTINYLFNPPIDTISPIINSKFIKDNSLKIEFSEEVVLQPEFELFTQIDSIDLNVEYTFENQTLITMVDSLNKVIFLGKNISDKYGNLMEDSLVTIQISPLKINLISEIVGGEISGKIVNYTSKDILVNATEIHSNESTIIQANPIFEFNNLPPGKYQISAYEKANSILENAYFSGIWSPYIPAVSYTIYPDTIDVRARWKVEGIQINMQYKDEGKF